MIMGMAYNPRDASRANDFQIEYTVGTTGNRWFIPYNDNDSMADQLAQCKKLVGQTTDGTDCGVESVV